ncbi:MAG: DsbA family oxidoreductase [Alphaproteobacteria bacterium]|nr:DsbA family oxidoreductase [Alphaproteobacteria bacterium]
MRIDIVFDIICPWCYVGKRRIERAMAQRPMARIDLCWRPFLLNPDMPPDGMDHDSYLESKFGGSNRIQRVFDAVRIAGNALGIPFDFNRIRRTPATVNAHRVIRFAAGSGRQADVVEDLFHAYFVDGADLGDDEVLVGAAERAGLDGETLRAHLRSDTDVTNIFNDNARAHRTGVSGVPCFVFNDSFAIAGAQEIDVFVRLIDLAIESEDYDFLSNSARKG